MYVQMSYTFHIVCVRKSYGCHTPCPALTFDQMPPKALIFDVFGTLVDWRTSVARFVAPYLQSTGTNPTEFAVAWRNQYQPAMERIRAGNRGYVALDDLHLENLPSGHFLPCHFWGVTPAQSVSAPPAINRDDRNQELRQANFEHKSESTSKYILV